jgi:hypothetical protein
MSVATKLVSRTINTKNSVITTSRADEVVLSFIQFKDAIQTFTLDAKQNKNSPSNSVKHKLKEDVTTILYVTQKLENALKNYAKFNEAYNEKLTKFINQIKDFRIHMLPRIKTELSKNKPQFLYKANRRNTFNQNLRNNITMIKTRPKNIKNIKTGQIKQIEYISIPQLDKALEDILPERSYSKIHPYNNAAAAANVEGLNSLFGSEGGRRKTRKRT